MNPGFIIFLWQLVAAGVVSVALALLSVWMWRRGLVGGWTVALAGIQLLVTAVVAGVLLRTGTIEPRLLWGGAGVLFVSALAGWCKGRHDGRPRAGPGKDGAVAARR